MNSDTHSDPPSQADPGSSSHYRLYKPLGAGAMGEIWQAQDQGLKRHVAYKRLHAHTATNQEALARFLREMQITAQLDHPNIVPVYECELNSDGTLAYSMKWVKGRTLKDYLIHKKNLLDQNQTLGPEYSLERVLEYFLSVCEAMQYAHSKGVIHRDLKPVNIMIGEFGEVYVMDWGIARVMGAQSLEQVDSEPSADQELHEVSDARIDDVDETRIGQILGTPRYMSPQQAAGKNQDLDGRSDQFALALILFEILCLKPAFIAPNAIEMLKKVLKVEFQAFTPYHPHAPIPQELQAITLKALSRKPDQRYPNLQELIDDIRRWQQGLAVKAQRDSLWQASLRWISQHRSASLAICLGFLLVFLMGIGVSLYRQQATLARERIKTANIQKRFGDITQQAQKIDSHFLKMQGLLAYLAAASIQYLQEGQASTEPYYSQHPYLAPNQIDAPLFGGKISIDWPTAGFAPGKSMKDMQGQLVKLLPVRKIMKDVLLRSYTESPETLNAKQIQNLIGTQGTPIMWAHVSLPQGVNYMYPGIAFNTPDWDPRTRPYYKLAEHKKGYYWGSPYFDPLSGALLPCATALYDSTNRFLGVAVIDLRFQYVIDHLLRMPEAPDAKSFLLNAKGEIILRSDDPGRKSSDLTKGYETPLYPDPAVIKAIRSQQTGGYFEKNQQTLMYSRLNTMGWYYVAELNSGKHP